MNATILCDGRHIRELINIEVIPLPGEYIVVTRAYGEDIFILKNRKWLYNTIALPKIEVELICEKVPE
ncbi:MAG: hypothetical protein VSS75_031240 [Candidatus Parabeggiatoa sp.]|nr:hypothetical protein [Candidatus Parabeggiatoa sp.]